MSFARPVGYERHSAYGEPERGHVWEALLRVLVVVASIGVGLGALRNIFSDTVEIGRMAMAKVCAEYDPPCHAQMTRWERSAIAQTFHVRTPSGPAVVPCQREFFLLGEFRCALQDSATPTITAEPPAPVAEPSAPTTAKAARSAPAR